MAPIRDDCARLQGEHPVAGQPIGYASMEGLYLLKLYALSSIHQQERWHKPPQAEADLFALLHHHPRALPPFADQVAPHLPDHQAAYLRECLLPNLLQRHAGGPRLLPAPPTGALAETPS